LIVGLAPGLRGANRTGRPFTGDYAGDLLYPTLLRHGFASGEFKASPDDGLTLLDCRITNAVRCVPPANKPVGAEINACRSFLEHECRGQSRPSVILTLGGIAHNSTLRALGLTVKAHPFVHGAVYEPPSGPALCPSYHCSRYNVNTGRLTDEMFDSVVKTIRQKFF
jgi:uracil-DNA glycosylase family 4